MLNQETKDKLEGLGFDVSKLEEAVKGESEESLDVPNLKKEDDLVDLISKEDKEVYGRNRFEEGKRAMSEIKAKEYKEKYNIQVDGKDLDTVIDTHINKQIEDAGKSNDGWSKEKRVLQKKVSELETQLNEQSEKHKQEQFITDKKIEVSMLTPSKTKSPKEDIEDLFFMRYRVAKDEDGRTVWYKGDTKLVDSKLEPLSTKDVYAEFMDQGGYLVNNGMGGDDLKGGGSTGKFKSQKEFEKWCAAQPEDSPLANPMSDEAQKVLRERKDEAVPQKEFY